MGRISFHTDMDAGFLIAREIAPYKVRMFTATHRGAAAAMVVHLDDANREKFSQIYDIQPDATHVTMGLVILGSGLHIKGNRVVEMKFIDETHEPYDTCGANQRLLDCLTPLRALGNGDDPYLTHAWAWRNRVAMTNAGKAA